MKKTFLILGALFFAAASYFFFSSSADDSRGNFDAHKKNIRLFWEGNSFEARTAAGTVKDFLAEQNISVESKIIFPGLDEKIYAGSKIFLFGLKKISVEENKNTANLETTQKTIEEALWENKNISFSEDDITKPSRKLFVEDGMKITITHVQIKEEIRQEDVKFKTVENEDDSMGWRVRKVTQKGERGIIEVRYKVIYHNGKEISRKILEKSKLKDPVDEIVTQGTFVKTAKKAHTGWGTWYAFKGGNFAASPWLPMGSYARVTNKANGKSVIVQINDRGPFGENRIIDLDKVAFAKIASLGAGVIDVKVEEVLN